jgi:hypothetical protein
MGRIGCPETSININHRFVTSQKGADLNNNKIRKRMVKIIVEEKLPLKERKERRTDTFS